MPPSLAKIGMVGVALILTSALRAEHVYPVVGVVRAPLEGASLVVAHDEIVGYMPAMTMRFKVAAAARSEAAALQPGDRVTFSLHVDAETEQADGFHRLGRTADPAAVRATPSKPRRLQEGDRIPAFALVDEHNQPLTSTRLSGHATVLTFIFTRCPVPEYCPLMARRFGELQQAIAASPDLRGRAELLSVTLDPEFDRPAVLAAYGRAVGADPAVWHFATGAPSDVTRLVSAFSVYTERNGVQLEHTLCTALIDGSGRVVTLWRGNTWKTGEVLQALRAAQ